MTFLLNTKCLFPTTVNEHFMPSQNQNDIFTVMILLCFLIGQFAFVKLKKAVKWKLITNRAY